MLSLTFIFNFSIVDYAQSELTFSSCAELFFEVNNSTSNSNQECSRNVLIKKSASYSNPEMCTVNTINWVIFVDLWNDGVYDFEYNSNLTPADTIFDDTNGNGISDIYIEPTLSNVAQEIEMFDVDGPYAEHTIYWNAQDDCESEVSCTQDIILLDTEAPVPLCISLSTYVFGPSEVGSAEIFAEDYNIGAYDNCTPSEELRFSFSDDSIVPSRPVTCDDVINSPVEIEIYVWDNQDNINLCYVFLTVIPGPTVDCYPYLDVDGYVKTEDNKPIHNAGVTLHCNLPEYPRLDFTNADGYYSFANVPMNINECYLTVDKEDEYITDVSTLDLVKIVRHILDIQPFNSPYQLIASDVTGDDKVKASDLTVHRKLILGVISELQASSPWVFLDESYEFNDPYYPWNDLGNMINDPHRITLTPNFEAPYNFVGIKLGNIVD